MKFSIVVAFITAIVGVAAAPGKLEARDGGLECCKIDGKWHWGWEGSEPSEQYICATGGLLNILNCVSVLDGSTIEVPINLIL